jgi:hypothetical protein
MGTADELIHLATAISVLGRENMRGQVRSLERVLSKIQWLCDDRILPTDSVRLFRSTTIKSLHKRGLLDANFYFSTEARSLPSPRSVGQ